MSSTYFSIHLKQEGSATDLALRGFGPAEVLSLTGLDIGPKGNRFRNETSGIDRAAYSAAHVYYRLGQEWIDEVSRQYEDGVPHADLLRLVGLRVSSPGESARLRAVFRALGIDPKRKKYAPTVQFTGLFDEGTAYDLACRGFNKGTILEATGTDLGGPRSRARDEVRGIDPITYATAHVRARIEPARLEELLTELATDRLTKAEVFDALGLGLTTMTLEDLFAGLGVAEQFRQAQQQRWQTWVKPAISKAHTPESKAKKASSLRTRAADPELRAHDVAKREATMQKNYGVKSPLQSPEIRRQVRETTQERYGYSHHNRRPERREAMREALVNGRIETMQEAKDYSPESEIRRSDEQVVGRTRQSR
jgi:hypothetical protein